MRLFRYLLVGTLFGIVMTKSEAISWFRIQEMFHFDSFHMYGIIGTAVMGGMLVVALLKRRQVKNMDGGDLALRPKAYSVPRYLLGGTVFGLGWAMTGACPGPMFTLVGHGIWAIVLVIASAVLGTLCYGALQSRLPH